MVKRIIKNIIPSKIIYKYKMKKLNIKMNHNKNESDYSKIEKYINDAYFKSNNSNINWDNPVTYTEKINFSKLYNSNNIKTKLADKYLVRDWIKNRIGDKYLVPLIGVYNNFDEINFDSLPNQFVIKCNHDSGSVTICSDKSKLNKKELKEKYNYYLKRNMAYLNYEMHYKDIIPKIIIEEKIGENINDYKFLCFDGKVYYCWVDFNRFSNHKRNIYDLEWNLQPFNQYNYGNYLQEIKKPEKFDEMIEIAKKVSEGFDHVRVDLYEINNKIYFSEMTFTNGNGMEPIIPHEYDIMLGNLWNINLDNRKKLKRGK